MIADCRAGKINRILVKSISRFGRNTVDTLSYIRELKELGISVFFESEQIDTLTAGGEVLITILAAIAEQESRNMSTNIKWAFQKRFKDGRVIINFRNTMGYTKEGDEYVIVEEEAVIVRQIFRDYLSGKTPKQIADDLNEKGVRTKRGSSYSVAGIQSILDNEKYTGNAILGKSFKRDVLSKRREKNNGQAPQYYVENSHPAIISQELFNMVQAEKKRRSELRSNMKTGSGKYSSLYVLSGLLVCGDCGSKFRRYGRKLANGEFVATWVCQTHQNHSEQCKMKPVKEDDIYDAYKRVVARFGGDMTEIIEIVKDCIEEETAKEQENDLAEVENKILSCQKEVLELFKAKKAHTISNIEYEREYERLSGIIEKLQAEKREAEQANIKSLMQRDKLQQINAILTDDTIDCADAGVMKILLDCIKVIDKHHVEFQFKCGLNATETI
jgi:DNA invertase Pin-like site-specific DNA recombinase